MAHPQIDLGDWLHRTSMTPHTLSETLGIDRWQISSYLAKEEPLDALTTYALKGLEAELGAVSPSIGQRKVPSAALAEGLYGDKWAERTARLIVPILTDAATNGQRRTMTYTEVHAEVVKRGGADDVGRLTKYAFALGKVAVAMEETGPTVPPLTSLVVSKQTGMPSSGIDVFVKAYFENTDRADVAKRMSSMQGRVDAFAIAWNDVFNYKDWPTVLSGLGLTGDPDFDR